MNYINPDRKLLQHLGELDRLKKGRNFPPVNVEIDLTNRCSLGCRWCHFAYTHTRGPLAQSEKPSQYLDTGDEMDVDLAFSIIRQLKEYGVKSITWTGGGEPTLHPYFDDIVTRVEIDQGIYTHGGHITERLARILKRHFKWVYVSLDCIDKESYLKQKQVDRFGAALLGIENLKAADGPATIGVGFLINKDSDLWETRNFGLSLETDYIQLRPVIQYDHDRPGELAENVNWLKMTDIYELTHHKKVIVDPNRFGMYKHWIGHHYQTCWWSGLQSVITPNGKVWACVNKRGFKDALLGDLNHNTFQEIWGAIPLQSVNDRCRIMCRGHVPNVALDEMFKEIDHANFI
jgi:MoaA/NifB/PqqE/SkfB family radical SAM enzyme